MKLFAGTARTRSIAIREADQTDIPLPIGEIECVGNVVAAVQSVLACGRDWKPINIQPRRRPSFTRHLRDETGIRVNRISPHCGNLGPLFRGAAAFCIRLGMELPLQNCRRDECNHSTGYLYGVSALVFIIGSYYGLS